MELPAELTRIPLSSLDLLRYMGKNSVEAADAESLAEGMGVSDRAIRKAIRGLVTANYLNMDSDYVYFLTEKGTVAIEDIAEYDAANPSDDDGANAAQTVSGEIIAVAPNPINRQASTSISFGMGEVSTAKDGSQLILRLSTTSGSISPQELTLDLGTANAPVEAFFTPSGAVGAVRVRVEAVQLYNMTEVHPAGGMFFDVNLSDREGQSSAWYGDLSLQA